DAPLSNAWTTMSIGRRLAGLASFPSRSSVPRPSGPPGDERQCSHSLTMVMRFGLSEGELHPSKQVRDSASSFGILRSDGKGGRRLRKILSARSCCERVSARASASIHANSSTVSLPVDLGLRAARRLGGGGTCP